MQVIYQAAATTIQNTKLLFDHLTKRETHFRAIKRVKCWNFNSEKPSEGADLHQAMTRNPSGHSNILRSDFTSYLPLPAWRSAEELCSGWAEAQGCWSESPPTRPRPWPPPPPTAARRRDRFWWRSLNTPRPRGSVTWLLNDAANHAARGNSTLNIVLE